MTYESESSFVVYVGEPEKIFKGFNNGDVVTYYATAVRNQVLRTPKEDYDVYIWQSMKKYQFRRVSLNDIPYLSSIPIFLFLGFFIFGMKKSQKYLEVRVIIYLVKN